MWKAIPLLTIAKAHASAYVCRCEADDCYLWPCTQTEWNIGTSACVDMQVLVVFFVKASPFGKEQGRGRPSAYAKMHGMGMAREGEGNVCVG